MKETLASVLAGGAFARQRAQAALRFAWCVADVQARPTPPVGAALGVSATEDGSAALWSIQPEDAAPGDWLDFVSTGADAAADAGRVARRHCPALVCPRGVIDHPPRLRALRVANEGSRLPSGLDGRSFGVAMCLARLSALLDLPVAPDLVATGDLRIDASVGGVQWVAGKVDFVARWAPGVRKVLVAEVDEGIARLAVAATRADLEVVPLQTIEDAIPHAFPADAIAARLLLLESTGEGPRLIRDLFGLAIGGRRARPRWESVARVAQHVERNPLLTPVQAAQVRLVQRIALRHEGGSSDVAIRPEDVPPSLPLESRFELMAHVLQSQADAASPDWRTSVATAHTMLRRPDERSDAEVMVLGAKARLLAAWREDDAALALLHECVQYWMERKPSAASFALCELLRIMGMTGRTTAVFETIEVWAPGVWRELDDVGTTFVALAIGRALVQVDRGDLAREWLSDGARLAASKWSDAMPHVERSRRRWLARALEAAGERDRARAMRATLTEATCPGNLAFAMHLARIDAAFADGGDAFAHAEALATEWASAHDYERILGCTPAVGLDARERARHVAETWRY